MAANLGEFEQLVLLALLRLRTDGYGVSIREEIERRAGRATTLGTVYKTLIRLESKGLVSTHLGDPTPERGGRRKKHYALTGAGRQSLERSMAALRGMTRGLDRAFETR